MTTQTQQAAFVAQEIKRQLGNQFTIMTGAKNFTVVDEKLGGLRFRLPGFVRNGINTVTIVLGYDDTYTVEFIRSRGPVDKVIASVDDVYAEDLQTLFTTITGLYTRL